MIGAQSEKNKTSTSTNLDLYPVVEMHHPTLILGVWLHFGSEVLQIPFLELRILSHWGSRSKASITHIEDVKGIRLCDLRSASLLPRRGASLQTALKTFDVSGIVVCDPAAVRISLLSNWTDTL